jgi:hypothetical protein
MKKLAAALVFATLLAFASASQGMETGVGCTVVAERGPVSSRLCPSFLVSAAYSFPFAGGDLALELSTATGTLIGQALFAEISGLYGFGMPGSWSPRVGVSIAVDAGDYFFSSSGSLDLPPTPQAYLGILLEPLRFIEGPWAFSRLRVSAAAGLWGFGSIFRIEVGILGLTYRWEP